MQSSNRQERIRTAHELFGIDVNSMTPDEKKISSAIKDYPYMDWESLADSSKSSAEHEKIIFVQTITPETFPMRIFSMIRHGDDDKHNNVVHGIGLRLQHALENFHAAK